jgi:serine phosphatase RsbU (regulator of sigma subunit)/ligand-binding sensor domain-containing protein
MKLIFSSVFILVTISSGFTQNHLFPLKNFTTRDYGRDFHPVNMDIVQDQRGFIYAANAFKLLEYDGKSWASYPINKEAWILSLAIDSSGIIFVGSQNEFGLFEPDPRGRFKYRSLSDSLDILDSDFKNVWKVHAFSATVAFQADEKLFLYKKGKIDVIKPETSFHTSFLVNNNLYIRERGIGLMVLENQSLKKVEGSELFDTTGIFMMLPFGKSDKKILIGTREKGFWLFDTGKTKNQFTRFRLDAQQMVDNAKITGGALTSEGQFAISTMLNGLILIDSTGSVKEVINKNYGLSDNGVNKIISDQNQNLWLALNNGLSTIEISSPISVFDERSGISGNINDIRRYNGNLYIGSASGLFEYQPDSKSQTRFTSVENLTFPVRSIIEADGLLITGTDAGIFQVTGNNIISISSKESYTLFYSSALKLLISGGSKGLNFYRKDGPFKILDIKNDITDDIISIVLSEHSNTDTAEFWIGTRYTGVIRMKICKDMTLIIDRYNSSEGLPSGPVTPYNLKSEIVFGTIEGIYGFISENLVNESLPDSLKNIKSLMKGYFSPVSITNEKTGKAVSSVMETKSEVWICSDNRIGFLDKKNNSALMTQPFMGIDVGKINVVYPEDDGICWFGTTDGLIRYDRNSVKNYNSLFHSYIRKVSLIDLDSLIFMGANFISDSGFFRIMNNQPSGLIPVLPFSNNSIRLEFSVPFFEYPEKILYSCQLEGNNSKWTQWTQDNFQEYTNLREGDYKFNVKAINAYGVESGIAQYCFKIMPPWYRSLLAYFSYFIFAVFFVWFIVRLNSKRLKRENIRLEGIVTERTAEVVSQKDEIEQKNIVLEYQKKEIEDSIRYASRIQTAVIPSEKDCNAILPESFVFFRPLNIVSGDFYWISKVEKKIVFSAADCTGHGVPGAIMSMLGIAFLNEIVNKDLITEPDKVLENLRNKVIMALQQRGLSGESRDGMDIAVVTISTDERILQFAGAYNPLRMIRNGEMIEIAGDKMPIGIHEKMNPFTNHVINLEEDDLFYMASDGFEDQFGGPEGKKFKSKKFKEMLLEIHKYPLIRQGEIIGKRFEEWRGELTQIDDIVVTGFKVNI